MDLLEKQTEYCVVQMRRKKNRDYNEMKGEISKIFVIFNCVEKFFMFIHFLNTIN